jgi:hypothetical protein
MKRIAWTAFIFLLLIGCSSGEYVAINQEVQLSGVAWGDEVCAYVDFPGRVVDISIKAPEPNCIASYNSRILEPQRNRVKVCASFGQSCTKGSTVDGRIIITGSYLK